jgi:hypothetical protein
MTVSGLTDDQIVVVAEQVFVIVVISVVGCGPGLRRPSRIASLARLRYDSG